MDQPILKVKGLYCRECGAAFIPRQKTQVFCSRRCSHWWHRRAQVRGGQIYDMLMAWRRDRGRKKGQLTEIAAVVDKWLAEDRERDKLQEKARG